MKSKVSRFFAFPGWKYAFFILLFYAVITTIGFYMIIYSANVDSNITDDTLDLAEDCIISYGDCIGTLNVCITELNETVSYIENG